MSLMQRIMRFLSSPQGRMVVDRGRRELAKPQNQQKLQRVIGKIQGHGKRH